MTNENRKEFEELREEIELMQEEAAISTSKEELERLETVIEKYLDKVEAEMKSPEENSTEYKNALGKIRSLLIETEAIIARSQEELKETTKKSVIKEGIKLGFVSSWFKEKALKVKELLLPEDLEEDFEDLDEEIEYDAKKTIKKAAIIGTGAALIIAATLGGRAIIKSQSNKKAEALKAQELDKDTMTTTQPTIEVEKVEETKEETVEEFNKEEAFLDLAEEIKTQFNKFDGINVSTEQTLALLIHLNVGNSYMNENKLALDKITRETLIKKYFVGLEENTEEFDSYTITDDDLSKVTNYTQELRNELVNRVIVLNDEGKYDESKAIIETLELFITDATLQDEAQALTKNVMSMQSGKVEDIKKGAYRWYNYIFAGPKSDVRNFDDYGYLKDADNKEMTFENQEMTIRFYTWYLDTFVDIMISGKNIIPQDIINSKEVKLMDQANLMRALGYKNCTAWAYTTVDFDNALETKGSKGSKGTGSKSGSKSSGSNASNIAHATNNQAIDQQIDQILEQNSTVGSSSVLQDGSVMTVIESGERETTVVIQPTNNNPVVTETQPQGPTKREEVIQGGGNEVIEEIHFEEDQTEVIIQQGGKSLQEESTSTYSLEEEEVLQTSSIRDQINFLNSIKVAFNMKYPETTIEFEEEVYQKTMSC